MRLAHLIAVLGAALCLGAAPASAQEARIVFASGPDDSGSVQRMVDAFNASHPGEIQVSWQVLDEDNDVHRQQLLEALSTDSAPHVFASDVVWTAELANSGRVEDLTRRFYRSFDRSDFLEPSLDSATWRLRIWGVPWYADAGVLFYRKDLLDRSGIEAPPATWDELASVATRVQQASGVRHGYAFQGAEYEGGTVNAAEFIWGAGGDLMRTELRATGPLGSGVVEWDAVAIDSAEAAAGLDMARRLVVEGIAPAEVATWREKEAVDAFLAGDAVFLRGWPYVHEAVRTSALTADQVGVAPLPALSAERAGTSCLGGWNLLIRSSASEAEQDAAWAFVRYLTAPEQQKQRALEAGLLPVLGSLYEDADVLAGAPVVALAAESMSLRVRVRPLSPFYPQMSSHIASGFHRVLAGEVTGAEAVDSLDAELRAIATRNR